MFATIFPYHDLASPERKRYNIPISPLGKSREEELQYSHMTTGQVPRGCATVGLGLQAQENDQQQEFVRLGVLAHSAGWETSLTRDDPHDVTSDLEIFGMFV